MRRIAALLAVAPIAIGAVPPARDESSGRSASAASDHLPARRMPGFAAALSERPMINGPSAWKIIADGAAWTALARSTAVNRQSLRWDYARSLIGRNLGDEALGVLDVMKADDPDLALVPAWQLARGAALTQMGRGADALIALQHPALQKSAEACLWRMRAMSDAGHYAPALIQMRCATSAVNARPIAARQPFVIAAARAAIEADEAELGLKWLRLVVDSDPAANLYRGKAYLALGEAQEARLRFARVAISGNAEQKADARISELESAIARRAIPRAKVQEQLNEIRFTWRGGSIEERALRLSWRLADQAYDLRGSLSAGATLFRHFDLGRETGPTLLRLQGDLGKALAAESTMPVAEAAGLYWDYRDLSPGGAEGDLLASRLASRLQADGLYLRAAELLRYQLHQRARDLAQGPLSVRVASLFILAGRPDRAARALSETAGNPYPDAMLWDRRRVEAAALYHLGKKNEALAVLQDVPDGAALRTEIYWKERDWASLASAGAAALPEAGRLSEVEQAKILRHAIALAMLGREDALTALRSRYGAAFATLPSGVAFDGLTRSVGALDSAAISKAMAAIPGAGPAGPLGELFDAAPVKLAAR